MLFVGNCVVPRCRLSIAHRRDVSIKAYSTPHNNINLQDIVHKSFGEKTSVYIQTIGGYVYMYIETGVTCPKKCEDSYRKTIQFLNRWSCYQYLFLSLETKSYDKLSPTTYRIPLGIGFYHVDPSNGF